MGGTGDDSKGGCWLLQDAREQLQADRCSSNLLCKLLCSCLPCRPHRHTRVLGVSRAYQAFSLVGLGVGGIKGGSEGGGWLLQAAWEQLQSVRCISNQCCMLLCWHPFPFTLDTNHGRKGGRTYQAFSLVGLGAGGTGGDSEGGSWLLQAAREPTAIRPLQQQPALQVPVPLPALQTPQTPQGAGCR